MSKKNKVYPENIEQAATEKPGSETNPQNKYDILLKKDSIKRSTDTLRNRLNQKSPDRSFFGSFFSFGKNRVIQSAINDAKSSMPVPLIQTPFPAPIEKETEDRLLRKIQACVQKRDGNFKEKDETVINEEMLQNLHKARAILQTAKESLSDTSWSWFRFRYVTSQSKLLDNLIKEFDDEIKKHETVDKKTEKQEESPPTSPRLSR